MRRRDLGWVTATGLAASACVANPHWCGPLPVRNQHPAQLTVMHLPPAGARVLPGGAVQARLDAAYSSLFLQGTDGTREWRMDGEYLRAGPSVRVGVGAGVELGAELPFAHTSGGFLDSFIIDYHDAFGLPDQNRDSTERDQFAIDATRDGATMWEVERDGFAVLDVPVHATLQVLEPRDGRFGAAVRAGVELPTGDDERGYGSGELEPSVGMVTELHAGGVAWYAHAQHTFAGTPAAARRAGLEFADVTSLGAGAELPLTTDLHALIQVEWETSTLRNFGLDTTDRDQLMLWVGGRYTADALGLEIAFGEDLIGLASPDFTAWLGLAYAFGGE
jgi:hypothetical protein